MTYLYKGVNLTQILHAGTSALSGYNITTNTNIDFLTTNKANNKPLTIPYLYQDTALSNTYAATHQLFDTPASQFTAITKPVGANALRYIITGAGGGGGGGSGGAWEGSGDNHATGGFNGSPGALGGIKYSTSDISITNVNQIYYWIGGGGNGGAGSGGAIGGIADNHNVVSNVGGNGNPGNSTNLNVGGTLSSPTAIIPGSGVEANVTGGAAGGGAAGQYANSSFGHGGSFFGAENATANSVGTRNNNTNYGGNVFGNSELRLNHDGNTNLLNGPVAATNADVINNTNWDNSIYNPTVAGGNGGAGGWGYSNSVNAGGANDGQPGTAGTKGRVTIIWLY